LQLRIDETETDRLHAGLKRGITHKRKRTPGGRLSIGIAVSRGTEIGNQVYF